MSTRTPDPPLVTSLLGELVGTFILVFFGCGAVHSAVLMDGLQGLWQVAIVWGIAIMLAIYTVGSVSGAHINPAITVALALWNMFPRSRVLGYIAAQLIGAFGAAAVLFALFHPYLRAKEEVVGVTRGQPGSVLTAMCYGEYYPNPGAFNKVEPQYSDVKYAAFSARMTEPIAILAEFLGTLILGFVIVGVTDKQNTMYPGNLAPPFIGLTVAALICVIAPLTQACFNPARDLGPRLFAYLAGWGEVAIPGPNGRGFVTVYILAPICGAIVGVAIYRRLFQSAATAAQPQ